MESWVQSWRPRTIACCDFSALSVQHCACHEKVTPGHTKCCTCHAKSSVNIWCSKMQPPLRKSAPWLPNFSDADVSCSAPATRNASLQILLPRLLLIFETDTKPSCFDRSWQNCRIHRARHEKSCLNMARTCGDFKRLTSKRASRHSRVHFFDISTSKSTPTLRCFCHLELQMCFTPQRRAIFDLLSDQMATHPPL